MSDESARPRSRCFRLPSALALAGLALVTHHSSLITAKAQPPFYQKNEDEDYYGAKGRGVRVMWVIEPREVVAGRDLLATLVVTGATNPAEITKPDLRKLKAFDAFKVTDAPDPPRDAAAKEVRFAYRLAPRGPDVTAVPPLRFRYFNPAAAPGKQLQLTATDDADTSIVVREAPKVERPVVPLDAPEWAFRVETGPGVLGEPFVPGRRTWLVAGALGPLAAGAWLVAWRRAYPGSARRARARRSRTARRAVELIRKAGRTPDPAAAVAAAVLGYLRARFPLPDGAVTPPEVATALRESDVPTDAAERVAEVLDGCDRLRFAPGPDDGATLQADAEALLARLEALA